MSDPHLEVVGKPLKGVDLQPVSGRVLKWDGSISFLGDVDPERGVLKKDGKEMVLKDTILVFHEGAGSTVGSYVVYNLRIYDNAPLAFIMSKADAIITIGCILADIPLVNKIDDMVMKEISTDDIIEVDTKIGKIRLFKKNQQ